jgi:murein DD-endopeptidase MepM/ murein hydrolase activator NlpD
MRIGATGTTPDPQSTSTSPGAASEANAPAFSTLLAQRMREPRDRIDLTRAALRAAIEGLRPGAATIEASAPAAADQPREGYAVADRSVAGGNRSPVGGADPFGWRSLTRQLGDDMVAPGFGQIFEAQIQQESGFSPEVAFGYRKSSAGAEGIAQLMPQYYQGVNRRDPDASLRAAATSMRHYLAANDGDVRKALASYNAGLGTVQSLVAAHGANWERGLPGETKQYLAAIVGSDAPKANALGPSARPFGGRGPHGVLTSPLDSVLRRATSGDGLALEGEAGATVRAPADGVLAAIEDGAGGVALRLDHGNGWASLLSGLSSVHPKVGDIVRSGDVLGLLGGEAGRSGARRLAMTLRGQAVDARPYLLDAAS